MPVTRSVKNSDNDPSCPPCHPWHGCTHEFGRKVLLTLGGVLLLYGIVFVGTLIRNNLQKYYFIGRADRQEHTIIVEGEGKVTAVPDVGVVTMGVITRGKAVAEAQQKSTDTMKALTDKLVALGIDLADIQTTNYNIYPKLKYTPDKGEEADGYEVSQSVTVKIRDVTKSNQVLALAGEVGANNVSGVQFVVDDPEVYLAQAREKALEVVAMKAHQLSRSLGVEMIGIVSYAEYYPKDGGDVVYMRDGYGGGGGGVSAGSNEIIVRASVTFEIR